MFNPVSTYRIQFHKEFTFSDLEKIIPYLQKLGVKTIYASPVFEAAPGSTHGYDGTNPNSINPEIGTKDQLLNISQILKEKNISWIQDIVPNHLSFHENNSWLMDVLEKGEASEYATYFDIDWKHPDYPGRLMVPFPGSPLEKILKEKFPEEKNYSIVPWQTTDSKINFRRFFLVNSLICTNIHDDNVFLHFHLLIKELLDKDVFQGLRVDHIDGLYDPTKYMRDLRKLAGDKCYIVVEKILKPGENMPGWPIQGSSGYDFLGMVNNLFTNQSSEFELLSFYFDLTGNSKSVEEQMLEKKSHILYLHMAGELDNLMRLYKETISDDTDDHLKQDIADYLISCPVYRYYDEDFKIMDRDNFRARQQLKKFYARCMQFTGPLTAKGVEDTLMYTYNRFTGHNEVGDSQDFFGYSPDTFHELMQFRNEHWPLSINGTSTHDTKRGEDVRARLNAVTDFHEEWIGLVKKWMEENKPLKKEGAPDDNDEYFIYQTLIGSYPVISKTDVDADDEKKYPCRLTEYLQKALRESKIHSDWTEPNVIYEEAAIQFTHRLIEKGSSFNESFYPFLKKISDFGMINSLGQMLLKFTCPGVPDIYQGTELWDLSLVDPDNRRPVDYMSREKFIDETISLKELWKTRSDGRIKLLLLQRLLNIRNRFMNVFSQGEYLPLKIEGKYKKKAIAFIRKFENTSVMSVVPLNIAGISVYIEMSDEMPQADWVNTKIILPSGVSTKWEDLLNGNCVEGEKEISLNEIFKNFPLGLIKIN